MGPCGTCGCHIVGAWMGQGLIILPANTKWECREEVPGRRGLGAELYGPQWLESLLSLVCKEDVKQTV